MWRRRGDRFARGGRVPEAYASRAMSGFYPPMSAIPRFRMAWVLFSLSSLSALVSRLSMSFIARARLTPTVFEAWMFVVTRLRTPI
jgi:hypothetical protein